MTKAAVEAGVTQTPTILVNGKQLGGSSIFDRANQLEFASKAPDRNS